MIKNNRQYIVTKRQVDAFYKSLNEIKAQQIADPSFDPMFQVIQLEAIRSQIDDLESEISEYEALTRGEIKSFDCNSLSELPMLLIKARIARGLSQKDLADKLGLKEQQIQRYEATDYESASLSRLLEVSDALGLKITQKIDLPETASVSDLLLRTKSIGLTDEFVLKKLVPTDIRNIIKAGGVEESTWFGAAKIVDVISRVFEMKPSDIFGKGVLSIPLEMAPSYKMPKKRDADFARAYTVYAHYLALLTSDLVSEVPTEAVPKEPLQVREEVIKRYGSLSFRGLLNFVWDLGVPVLPLNDSGAFHGACWRIKNRNVIVIKQKSQLEARWIFDLGHELFHASEEPLEETRAAIDVFDDYPNYKESPGEVAASKFAGIMSLGQYADKYAEECLAEATGRVELMRSSVKKVAGRYNLDLGILANYVAFRLSVEGFNWWGAAANLQPSGLNPWTTARDVFLQRVDISRLNPIDRDLIMTAMTVEEV